MGPDDMGLERRQIDFDNLVVVLLRRLRDLGVRHEQRLVGDRKVGQIGPIRNVQVRDHLLIEGKYRRGGAQFRAHVADRSLTGRADGFRTGPKVFNDLICSALHREQATEIQNHVLRRGPTAQPASQANADQFRMEYFPGQAGHHFAGIGATDTDG